MHYDKLVRDKIPEIIKSKGDTPFTHIADEKEYEEALVRKLQEEVDEFLAKPCAEEAADILEVLRAICALKNISLDNIEAVRQQKATERGGFEQRIILDKIENP
ncbi:nucleoside triphosphate pyrophosphohydrolase [Candidatus Kuenenbacteria bacterium]|nr:nucleoside triphosphate pyrophosphohydrolase [Candidatus Kuenenbacteria bacterium]